jgi:hypothetical protein
VLGVVLLVAPIVLCSALLVLGEVVVEVELLG